MTDVHKIFQEIEEKSKDGDYIYRGEPKCHETYPHVYGGNLPKIPKIGMYQV